MSESLLPRITRYWRHMKSATLIIGSAAMDLDMRSCSVMFLFVAENNTLPEVQRKIAETEYRDEDCMPDHLQSTAIDLSSR